MSQTQTAIDCLDCNFCIVIEVPMKMKIDFNCLNQDCFNLTWLSSFQVALHGGGSPRSPVSLPGLGQGVLVWGLLFPELCPSDDLILPQDSLTDRLRRRLKGEN